MSTLDNLSTKWLDRKCYKCNNMAYYDYGIPGSAKCKKHYRLNLMSSIISDIMFMKIYPMDYYPIKWYNRDISEMMLSSMVSVYFKRLLESYDKKQNI